MKIKTINSLILFFIVLISITATACEHRGGHSGGGHFRGGYNHHH